MTDAQMKWLEERPRYLTAEQAEEHEEEFVAVGTLHSDGSYTSVMDGSLHPIMPDDVVVGRLRRKAE